MVYTHNCPFLYNYNETIYTNNTYVQYIYDEMLYACNCLIYAQASKKKEPGKLLSLDNWFHSSEPKQDKAVPL